MDRDGAMGGYDLNLTRSVSDAVPVPVIALGGAGSLQDFASAVTEGGATATYDVVLESEPTADVTITPAGGAQLQTPAALLFTSANWDTAQTVTVTATDDAVAEGPHAGEHGLRRGRRGPWRRRAAPGR